MDESFDAQAELANDPQLDLYCGVLLLLDTPSDVAGALVTVFRHADREMREALMVETIRRAFVEPDFDDDDEIEP